MGEEQNSTSSQPLLRSFTRYWCVAWALYQIYVAIFPIAAFYERSIHLFFGLILVYLTLNYNQKQNKTFTIESIISIALIAASVIYAILQWNTKVYSRGMGLTIGEGIMGTILIIMTIEACRRTIGFIIPLVTVILVFYARYGEILPEIFAHPDYGYERMITSFYISFDGIMGPLMHVSTKYIFLFVLFGSFLQVSGGGEFFIKLAYCLCGRFRGGPAKIAVVASSFFGMISGSAMANVAGTGQFTIPLMKKYGYNPWFAAGVEAVASAGGQIMPPVMGGAAFIMIEILGISYFSIMKAILIISAFYYIGIFIVIDLEAQRMGLKAVSKEEITEFKTVIKEGWYFLIPPLLLIVLMGLVKYSLPRSAVYATLSIIVVSWFKKDTRMGIKLIFDGMVDTCLTFRSIVSVLACAGILVGLVNMTGLGLMLSSTLINLSHGNVLFLLFLTMIASIILGMGVPITASYIILSILVAPALIDLGILPIAAHLFIFYFGVFSAITPPFAPDAFVAAGIAGTSVMKTAISACKTGLIGIILPYAMVYNKVYLMEGTLGQIIIIIITSFIATYSIGFAVVGYFYGEIKIYLRIIFFFSGILMFTQGFKGLPIVFGLIIFFIFFIPRFIKYQKSITDSVYRSIWLASIKLMKRN